MGAGGKSEANPMSKRTTEKAREVQDGKMGNSDLGKLIIKGKRGWIFWISLGIKCCLAYVFGSLAAENFFYSLSKNAQFDEYFSVSDARFSLLINLICLFSILYSIVNHIYKGIKGSIEIYENGISLGKMAFLYTSIEKVKYRKLDKKDAAKSLIIYSENSERISFLPSIYSNESQIIKLIKQKLAEKLERSDFIV